MNTLAWIGIAILALVVLTWFVFKVTLWFAALLFVVGLAVMGWGFVKAKRAL